MAGNEIVPQTININVSNPPNSVISKDITLDPIKKIWVRLYLPGNTIHSAASSSSSTKKLPLIVYYHGGGFVSDSADTTIYDVFCKGLVENVGVIVISVNYRLAPEHRLPAAYEDAMEALFWIKNLNDEWLREYVDLEDCYLCGSSAGGNLAYNTGLHVAAARSNKDLEPLRIKGLILHHPYFSGKKRTSSELRLVNNPVLPLSLIDYGFDLSLPEGEDHDHEYCNPFKNCGSNDIDQMKELGFRVLVAGCYNDPLFDAGVDCANVLESKGLYIVRLYRDGYHNMEVTDPAMAGPLYAAIKDLVFENRTC